MIDLSKLVQQYDPSRKIDRPGIYANVPMDRYVGDLTIGPSVSHSVIWPIESKKSPKKAFANSYLNPNRKERAQAGHFSLGSAIHHLSSGLDGFNDLFVVRPVKWDSWRTTDAKNWRAEQILAGKTVLDASDIETIQGIADSMNEHPTIQAGILKGLVEMTVVYQDAATGLWVKTRPDVLPMHSTVLTDLKTAADASAIGCMKATGEFGYHGQLAMIDEALWQVAEFEVTDHVLAVIEKAEPYCVNIKPQPDWVIDYGRRQSRRALDTFADCLKSGDWPGYLDDGEDGSLPAWLTSRLAYEAENGLLPKISGRGDRAGTLAAMAPEETV